MKKLLDSIVYARLETNYVAALNHISKFNPEFGTWIERNSLKHWVRLTFPTKRWDKMSTSLAESVIAWLKFERQHYIYSFITEHMNSFVIFVDQHLDTKGGTKVEFRCWTKNCMSFE